MSDLTNGLDVVIQGKSLILKSQSSNNGIEGTFATNFVAYTAEPNNLDNESPAALITELLRSRVCNPLARSAGVFFRPPRQGKCFFKVF